MTTTMTRNRTYALTAAAAALYVALCWVFADGLFTGSLWISDDISGSSIFTYALLGLIVGAGVLQASRLPAAGVDLTATDGGTDAPGQVNDPALWKLLLGNSYLAVLWMPIRFFVGREWLVAGEHKLRDSGWMSGGESLKGYWTGAVAIPEAPARPKIVAEYSWFRDTLQYMLDNEWYTWFAKVVAIGEFLIGIGLILGALVGIAAFFGTLLNFNFQLAGTASTNPVLFGLGVFLILGWKVAGFWGLDRWLLAVASTPWKSGRIGNLVGKPGQPGKQPAPAAPVAVRPSA